MVPSSLCRDCVQNLLNSGGSSAVSSPSKPEKHTGTGSPGTLQKYVYYYSIVFTIIIALEAFASSSKLLEERI